MRIMEVKSHDFEVHGGEEIQKGKSHWPDCLNVTLSQWFAWDLVQRLLAQLKAKDKTIQFNYMGKLEYNVMEEYMNKKEASESDKDKIQVCDKCYQASCWQGIFICEGAKNVGTKYLTKVELSKLNLESLECWKTDKELAE